MSAFKKVEKKEFYATIGIGDVVCGDISFNKEGFATMTMKTRYGGKVVGKTIERLGDSDEDYSVTDYYISNNNKQPPR